MINKEKRRLKSYVEENKFSQQIDFPSTIYRPLTLYTPTGDGPSSDMGHFVR